MYADTGGASAGGTRAGRRRCSLALLVQKYLLTGTKVQILTPEELLQENTTKNLESEIVGYKSEAQKQRKMIYALEKEREKYGQQASDATAKYLEALEEVKIRQMTIMDLQKTVC